MVSRSTPIGACNKRIEQSNEIQSVELRLGLIGDNISASQSPRLHELAGMQHNINVRYDRLIPKTLGRDFESVFLECRLGDYRGINITFPYKEKVTHLVSLRDSITSTIGAVNTVIFEEQGPMGYNTDYIGFISAYRNFFKSDEPGCTVILGTGGVGRSIAFALVELGASEIRLIDLNAEKSNSLAESIRQRSDASVVLTYESLEEATKGAEGIINCTPLGMTGIGGTPIELKLMEKALWAFDAVYTPIETQFLRNARHQGLKVMSGYELFFYQAIEAWQLFSGLSLDICKLRNSLLRPEVQTK